MKLVFFDLTRVTSANNPSVYSRPDGSVNPGGLGQQDNELLWR